MCFCLCMITDDCQMVVRAGRASMFHDPPPYGVLGHPAGLSAAASAVQRPGLHTRSHRDAEPGTGSQALRPERHRAAVETGRQVRPKVHEHNDA